MGMNLVASLFWTGMNLVCGVYKKLHYVKSYIVAEDMARCARNWVLPNIPPNGESFSDLICIFAMSVEESSITGNIWKDIGFDTLLKHFFENNSLWSKHYL